MNQKVENVPVALITGAASGMGRATAHLFADEGAHVAATDVNGGGVAAVVAEIKNAGLSAEEEELFQGWIAAREAKDWSRADELRDQLKERGVQVQARKGESTWARA